MKDDIVEYTASNLINALKKLAIPIDELERKIKENKKGDNMNNKNDKLAIDFSCEIKRPVSEKDKNLVERHKNVCDMLNTIYALKNKAYGDSFGETYRDLGIISAVTRISDKFNRLKTLAKNAEIDKGDEAIEDTALDLANYCIMLYMELKKE